MASKANLGFRQATVEMWLSHGLPDNLLEVDAKNIQKFLLWLEKIPIEGVNRSGQIRRKNTVKVLRGQAHRFSGDRLIVTFKSNEGSFYIAWFLIKIRKCFHTYRLSFFFF
jgi:hypothetical protein